MTQPYELLTNVTLIVDESGSMSHKREATAAGIKEYLETFISETVDNKLTLFTLITFSNKLKVMSDKTVIRRDLQADSYFHYGMYNPNGGTALHDAIQFGVQLSESFPHNTFYATKARRNLVVIITDGEENASRYANSASTSKLIKDMESQGNYTFVFVGTNVDFRKVQETGFNAGSMLRYADSDAGVRGAYTTLSSSTRGFMQSDAASSRAFFGPQPEASPSIHPGPKGPEVRGVGYDNLGPSDNIMGTPIDLFANVGSNPYSSSYAPDREVGYKLVPDLMAQSTNPYNIPVVDPNTPKADLKHVPSTPPTIYPNDVALAGSFISNPQHAISGLKGVDAKKFLPEHMNHLEYMGEDISKALGETKTSKPRSFR